MYFQLNKLINSRKKPEVQPKNFAYFGSRVYFIVLAPCLLLSFLVFLGLGYSLLQEKETAGSIICYVLSICCFCGLLIGISASQFGWTKVIVTGIIGIGYIIYFILLYFIEEEPLSIKFNQGASSTLKAILGFVFIGIPCLRYTYCKIRDFIQGPQRPEDS